MADDNGNGNVSALQRLLDERTHMLERTGLKLRDRAKELDAVRAERDAALKARDEAMAAVQAAREEAGAPFKAELERLRAERREQAHRAAFERLAEEKGAPKESWGPLYQLSGYKAAGDEPDEAELGAVLDGLKEKPGTSRLFGEPAGITPSPPPPPPGGPAPGSGQGRRDVAPGKFRVTREQLADGAWCMANAARIEQAERDGTIEYVGL